MSMVDPPLGMESGQITNSQLKSSSKQTNSFENKARLNMEGFLGGWCAAALDEERWFAVHLLTNHVISAVSL